MVNRIRVFIAVALPPKTVGMIAGIEEKLKGTEGRISWVRPENIHITMRFLGDVEEGRIDDIHHAMSNAICGVKPFSILLGGVGAFPSLAHPRALWVGVDGVELLGTIYDRLEGELEGIGFAKERRPFYPHVTIGRVRRLAVKESMAERIKRLGVVEPVSVPVESLLLFKSDLQPSGAVHTVLREARLGE